MLQQPRAPILHSVEYVFQNQRLHWHMDAKAHMRAPPPRKPCSYRVCCRPFSARFIEHGSWVRFPAWMGLLATLALATQTNMLLQKTRRHTSRIGGQERRSWAQGSREHRILPLSGSNNSVEARWVSIPTPDNGPADSKLSNPEP